MSVTALREKILPAAFNQNGTKFVECELESGQEMGVQFQSNVVFTKAVLSTNNNNVHTKVPLVVKFMPANKDMWVFMNSPQQFHNEVLMYSEILPFLEREDIVKSTFPKFYHGFSDFEDPAEDVLIIQDLRSMGYRLTREKAFLSPEHLSVTIRKLGRFHALSYAAKKHSPEKFHSLVGSLKETSWMINNDLSNMLSACFHRAADPVIAQGKHVEVLKKLLDLVTNNLTSFMRSLVAPEEPMAVICHGDFCHNNMLFRYDSEETPEDAMFFDIATARYSSPVIDLAFHIFLNSSKDTRADHLDDWLRQYHDALSTAVPGVEVPSLDELREDFRQKAIYGFLHCSFFLPMMLYERPYESLDEAMEEEVRRDPRPWQSLLGGEEGTRLMVELISDLLDRGCLTTRHKIFA